MNTETLLNHLAVNIRNEAVAQVREHLLGDKPPKSYLKERVVLLDQLRDAYKTEFHQKVVAAICGPDTPTEAPYGFKKDGTPKKKPGMKAKNPKLSISIAWSHSSQRFVCVLPDGRQFQATRERDLVNRLRKLGFAFVSRFTALT